MSSLAQRLQELLDKREMTGSQLATELNLARGTVYNILNGKTSAGKITAWNAMAIAQYFRVDMEWLIGLRLRLRPQPIGEANKAYIEHVFDNLAIVRQGIAKDKEWREDVERRLATLEKAIERG